MGRRGKGKTRHGKKQKKVVQEKSKGRYLCVSNGFEIWCLDLDKSQQSDGPVPLPNVSVLNLVGGELPASVGLFKLGSDVYLIGGKQLPSSLKERTDPNSRQLGDKFRTALPIIQYKELCKSWGIKGSSRATYRLSLTKISGALCFSKASNIIKDLNNPKVWPIVEQIKGQLHVLESVPRSLHCCDKKCTMSHEVLNLDDKDSGWEDIIPCDVDAVHVLSHVVVGDRIYAVTHESTLRRIYYEFECRTRIWKRSPVKVEMFVAHEMKRVWHIITTGTGRCVGEYPCEGGRERVFVLIALQPDCKNRIGFAISTHAVAYLVTLTGRVICYQLLPDFFKRSMAPLNMKRGGTIIEVEEGGEMYCSVVNGTLTNENGKTMRRDFVFVNTFSVEMLTGAGDNVREILEEKAEEYPTPLQFVRVTHKDKFIYETDTDYSNGWCGELGTLSGTFVDWKACFL